MCLGGKTKDCRTPDDHPGRKGHFSKRVRNDVQNRTKMAWKMLLFIFSFFQIFSFSQRNWYCPVWIMGRSDSFCSTFLNFLNLQSRKQTEIAWPKSWKKSPQNKVENEPKLTTPTVPTATLIISPSGFLIFFIFSPPCVIAAASRALNTILTSSFVCGRQAAGKDYNARGRGRRRGAGTLKLYQGKKDFWLLLKERSTWQGPTMKTWLSLLTWFFFSPVLSSFPPYQQTFLRSSKQLLGSRKTFFKLLALPPYKKRGKR